MGFDKGYYDTCCCCKCSTASGHLAFGIITLLLSALGVLAAISSGEYTAVWYLVLGILTLVNYCKRDDSHGKGRVSFALCVYIYSIITFFIDYGIYFAIQVALQNYFIGNEEVRIFYAITCVMSIYLPLRLWQSIVCFWFYASLRDD